jgi:hypothetical protein
MSREQYLNKYEIGRGKWKRMAYDVFLVKTLRPALIVHVKHHLKECVYAAESLAHTMDLKHGINLGVIDAIHQIEPVQTRRKGRYEDKIIYGIQYDTEKLFTYLVNAFHLGELAKHETVEMAITVDRAKLDNKVHHVTIGFKICDKRACVLEWGFHSVISILLFSD